VEERWEIGLAKVKGGGLGNYPCEITDFFLEWTMGDALIAG
jgi:hypothetical protein